MRKEGWQASALFLLAGLILTSAASFYRFRVQAVRIAELEAQKSPGTCVASESESVNITTSDPAERARQARLTRAIDAQMALDYRPLAENERCIDNRRFRRVANGWASAGSCP